MFDWLAVVLRAERFLAVHGIEVFWAFPLCAGMLSFHRYSPILVVRDIRRIGDRFLPLLAHYYRFKVSNKHFQSLR